tara:strand:- start:204 stop:449 length:246 start_codon:yes stop_codon:yes gene_type:complete
MPRKKTAKVVPINCNSETLEESKKGVRKLNDTLSSMYMNIRNNQSGWLKKEGMCEICGNYPAEYNLDLKYGSHRECWLCWK